MLRAELEFLGRSIVIMWYLGAWYEPADLRKASTVDKPEFVPHTIISSKAYKEGWIWRIAQAHPMGSSDMQFGYWANAPKTEARPFHRTESPESIAMAEPTESVMF